MNQRRRVEGSQVRMVYRVRADLVAISDELADLRGAHAAVVTNKIADQEVSCPHSVLLQKWPRDLSLALPAIIERHGVRHHHEWWAYGHREQLGRLRIPL